MKMETIQIQIPIILTITINNTKVKINVFPVDSVDSVDFADTVIFICKLGISQEDLNCI
jgi:hypothetical protein